MSKERELLKECRLMLDNPINGTAGRNLQIKITELLAQPEPTSALPKREPLSDEKLKTIAVEDEFLLYCNEDEFIEIAREIEKAHGIGGGE